MGIKGLMKLLQENCPRAIKAGQDVETYTDKVIAIDASIVIYQFMSAIRGGKGGDVIVNPATGETISHLLGLFNRSITLLSAGVKPVFVFDGAAPVEKTGELIKRAIRNQGNVQQLQAAIDAGDTEDIARLNKRVIRVTDNHFDECRELLALMGIPIIEAPGEAEAQCAELVKSGVAYATATEDMDSLTFGSERLLRSFTGQKGQVVEIHLPTVLRDLKLNMQQFVDLCILLGCDYAGTINGLGPKTALKLIQQHQTMEGVISSLRGTRLEPKENDFQWRQAADMFLSADVMLGSELNLEWKPINEKALLEYLVKQKGFVENRVLLSLAKCKKAQTMLQARKQLASRLNMASKRKLENADSESSHSKRREVVCVE